MFKTSCVLHLATIAAFGQLMSGSASVESGVSFSFETRVEPPTPTLSWAGTGGVSTGKGGLVKRNLNDPQRKTYFGYDLRMEPLSGDQFRYTFLPLSIKPADMGPGWTMIPLPVQPDPRVVRTGDKISLVLFVNPSTGQKIVDYITVGGGKGRLITATGPARDFSTEQDLWLDVRAPKLTINGHPFDTTGVLDQISGSPLRIYIAGHGRFLFSLEPAPDLGLRKAGEVRGSTMTWRWGSDEYVLNSDGKIAPGMAAYNLYVYRDSSYRPKSGASFELGAGGSLEHLTR